MTDVEEKLGELAGAVDAMNQNVQSVVKLIPVVAVHESKLTEFEKNWQPKIEEHDQKINWVIGGLKVIGAIMTALGVIAGVLAGWFNG